MQKVIRRTALARNQAKRKAIRSEKIAERTEYVEFLKRSNQRSMVFRNNERSVNQHLREDWIRGPLAPRRDVGESAIGFGTLPMDVLQSVAIPKHLRRQYINIAPGDRVVCLKGKDEGKISEVVEVDPESETLRAIDMNVVCILIVCVCVCDCFLIFFSLERCHHARLYGKITKIREQTHKKGITNISRRRSTGRYH